MNANALYSTSQALRDIIGKTAAGMVQAVEQPIELVEVIILPDFGQRTILRFDIGNHRKVSFAEADRLESSLRRLAGSEYWVTLVGSCYQQPLPDLSQQLRAIDQRISSEFLQVSPTRHSEPIRADAQKLRGWLNLTNADLIWEIEVPVLETARETIIRIIDTGTSREGMPSPRNLEHIRVGAVDCAVVYLQNDPSFVGCIKAYLMAERQEMALASTIAQFA